MKTREEVKKVQDVNEVKKKDGGVAAFFDLDGTLISLPSLEIRFFRMLRYKKLIRLRNYCSWFAEAARLAPRGIYRIMHANKMYLRGISVNEANSLRAFSFFSEAIEQMAWHAERNHFLVFVSGTLQPLAMRAALAMQAELEACGLKSEIRVCATGLEVKNEAWTGPIVGEAMFGEAKARAIRRIADAKDLDLQRCFAYGDSANDKWMLEVVGKPAAVNPSNDLARIARRNDWAVLRWRKERTFAQSPQPAQRSQRMEQSERELQILRAKAGSGA